MSATQKRISLFSSKKIPGVFHKPKKITFSQNLRPKKITRNPPSLKYVSGAPGVFALKVAFSNLSGIVWTRPHIHSILVILTLIIHSSCLRLLLTLRLSFSKTHNCSFLNARKYIPSHYLGRILGGITSV